MEGQAAAAQISSIVMTRAVYFGRLGAAGPRLQLGATGKNTKQATAPTVVGSVVGIKRRV